MSWRDAHMRLQSLLRAKTVTHLQKPEPETDAYGRRVKLQRSLTEAQAKPKGRFWLGKNPSTEGIK